MKKEGSIVAVGSLQKIDENGIHFSETNNIDDLFSFFGSKSNKDKFQPTHFCKIELPKE